MKNIVIVECPSNLGLKEPSPGKEPGVRNLPESLRKNGFHAAIPHDNVIFLDPPSYAMELDTESGVRNADKIIEFAKKQSKTVSEFIGKEKFQLTIGGDCSILIGIGLGLKKSGRYGLFFLDGHTDFMWPELSKTGGAAGMDLAIVTGFGHKKLTDIENQKPYFDQQNIWCVGNRDYEDWYVEVMENSEIQYFDLNFLRSENGIEICISSFLQMVDSENLDGFWIHLDADVLNDEIMPCVDSRQTKGLSYGELQKILLPLLNSKKAIGLNLTIIDPDLDPENQYIPEFVNNFAEILKRSESF